MWLEAPARRHAGEERQAQRPWREDPLARVAAASQSGRPKQWPELDPSPAFASFASAVVAVAVAATTAAASASAESAADSAHSFENPRAETSKRAVPKTKLRDLSTQL